MARTKRKRSAPTEAGNFVSEWFGHRVYPTVAATPTSRADQRADRCPFLSAAIGEEQGCIKAATSRGICTISSCSNGPRQDWLVCPYRALEPALLKDVARRLFGFDTRQRMDIVPAPTLMKARFRSAFIDSVHKGSAGVVYVRDKLGGEISISPTDRSPEVAFDLTMVEVVERDPGVFAVGRYGILEVQTMDFHGSYRYAVSNLRDGLRLHRDKFPAVLQSNQTWLSDHIEGPNIANVFKRTFYQAMVKFQIAAHAPCAGCVLALPAAVWDSWQRHLAKPELVPRDEDTFALWSKSAPTKVPAWIYVFDIDTSPTQSPSPIQIKTIIATDAESIAHYALKVAPEAAVQTAASAEQIMTTLRRRLSQWWPGLEYPTFPPRVS